MLLPCLLVVNVIMKGAASVDMTVGTSFVVAPLHDIVSRWKREATADEVPDITHMYIKSKVVSRFATITVSSEVVNTRMKDLEATFSVQIPESAFISNFTMIINDTLLVGKVYEKKKAQEKYDKAKEQGQSAGQVRHQRRDAARGMDVFNINVNVAALSDVHFELTYLELLERRLGLYRQRIVVQPLQIVNNLTLDMSFSEPQLFDRFTYTEPNNSEIYQASSDFTVYTAKDSTRKLIYRPSVSKQKAMNDKKGIDGEFVVSYDVNHKFDGGNIISAANNKYFIHYFAVDISDRIVVMPKNIMFVIDISGSMTGSKIKQARDAMNAILPQLSRIDYFNIMIFDDSQEEWQNRPVPATLSNINGAKKFVDERVKVDGGTNINGALLKSVRMVANDPELSGKAGIIVFLTDGQPTSGETDIRTIRKNIKNVNENRVGVFSLGFGAGVDFSFLQKISWENGGFARRIYDETDAAEQLNNFFKEVKNPLLVDVAFRYPSNQVVEADVTRTSYKQVFSGTEILVTGKRITNIIDATVHGSTSTNALTLTVPATSQTEIAGPSGEFTEKLWAYLTIKDLLRKKAIAETDDEAKAFEARALKMSLDYNFVTPLTSLVVVQEDAPTMMDEKRMGMGGIMYSRIGGAEAVQSNAFLSLFSVLFGVIPFLVRV